MSWILVVGAGLALAGVHWAELTENITDRVLAAENIAILLITYPFIKALHELGHGYAVKRWGGEVHEMGIMLLVFFPVPYVEASASSAFASKWQRAAVGGIITHRQRPGTAKGVRFLNLEDETGLLNVVVMPQVWDANYEIARKAVGVIITGVLEFRDGVTNLVAHGFEHWPVKGIKSRDFR